MNREIKFRAWDIGGRMHYGVSIDADGCVIEDLCGGAKGGSMSREVMIPMQFTGLKDKNGQEIYEGDIVWCINPIKLTSDPRENDYCGIVKYRKKGAYYVIEHADGGCVNILGKAEEMKVLGNVHENPDLLEVD